MNINLCNSKCINSLQIKPDWCYVIGLVCFCSPSLSLSFFFLFFFFFLSASLTFHKNAAVGGLSVSQPADLSGKHSHSCKKRVSAQMFALAFVLICLQHQPHSDYDVSADEMLRTLRACFCFRCCLGRLNTRSSSVMIVKTATLRPSSWEIRTCSREQQFGLTWFHVGTHRFVFQQQVSNPRREEVEMMKVNCAKAGPL